ncbi:MAG: hypothetical protein U0517_02155 [Candidatus Andersenbacteria bacterium]
MEFPQHFTETQKKRIARQEPIAKHKGFTIKLSEDCAQLIWISDSTGLEQYRESVENYK